MGNDLIECSAAEADLTARYGNPARAAGLFRQAADAAHAEPERRALLDRADELDRGIE